MERQSGGRWRGVANLIRFEHGVRIPHRVSQGRKMTNEALPESRPEARTTLSSLAMLKVRIDGGADYLEYLRPYVLMVLSEAPPERITDAAVAAGIRRLSGLEIPSRTVQVVLQRLVKERRLERAHGVYVVSGVLPVTDAAAERKAATRKISSVVDALVKYSRESAGREISEEEASDSLVAFLSNFSIPCLKYYLRGTTLPPVNGKSESRIVLVSQFLGSIPAGTTLFDSFMTLVQGHMLANALLCPDLQSVTKSYKDVVFYLDTPLLIDLIGLAGEQRQQAIQELISLVGHLDGKIACFSHTAEELENTIRNSAEYVDSTTGRGSIVVEARRAGRTRSDLILASHSAAEKIERSGVEIQSTPQYVEANHRFEISEEAFSEALDDELTYLNQRAREYDIKSVRSVYVLRRGLCPRSLEKAKAVLVTNNAAFSKAAYDYGKRYEQSSEVSTVITDFSLANTAWLKAPQGAPTLPEKEVLAFAYATLRPSPEFWEKVLREAERLERTGVISARDHQLLRSSHHAQDELMRLTLGDDAALTDERISETLRRVTSEIQSEEAEKRKVEEGSRKAAEERHAAAEASLQGLRSTIFWRVRRTVDRESKIVKWAAYTLHACVAIFAALKISDRPLLGWATLAFQSIGVALKIVGLRWDLKPSSIEKSYGKWRLNRLTAQEEKELKIKIASDEPSA